jgi:hypothetical protein
MNSKKSKTTKKPRASNSAAPMAQAPTLAQAYDAELAEGMAKKSAELEGAGAGKLMMAQAELGRAIVTSWLKERRAANKAASFAPGYDPAAAARAEAEIVRLLAPTPLAPKR